MFLSEFGVIRAEEFAEVLPGLPLIHLCPVLFGASYSLFSKVGSHFLFDEGCLSGGGVKGFPNGVKIE